MRMPGRERTAEVHAGCVRTPGAVLKALQGSPVALRHNALQHLPPLHPGGCHVHVLGASLCKTGHQTMRKPGWRHRALPRLPICLQDAAIKVAEAATKYPCSTDLLMYPGQTAAI